MKYAAGFIFGMLLTGAFLITQVIIPLELEREKLEAATKP